MKQKTIKFLERLIINIKKYITTNILFLTFVVTSVINGCLLRFLTIKNYFEIEPILADIAVVLMVGSIGYLFQKKNQIKYFLIMSIIFVTMSVVNSMYYTNYLSFASFSLLKTSLQIVDVGDAVVNNVMEKKDFSYLWQLVVLIFVYVTLKKKNYFDKIEETKNKKTFLKTIIVSLLFVGLFVSTLTSFDISRLSKKWNREYIVKNFGIFTYQFNDLFLTLKTSFNPLAGYDESNKEVREYYKKNEKEQKENEYTDIFKGKNILTIHAESIQQYVLDMSFNGKEVAPNLKKLASEGLYFSNFHSEESVGTSSDTEFTLNTSLMPSSSGTVFVSYFDRDYLTIPKLLAEKDYYSFSMHGNNCDFWNRQAAHKSFGYNKFYCSTKDFDTSKTIGLGLSDKSFFKQAVPKIETISKENKNFYGTLIMLTNHTPFTGIEDYSDYKVTYEYKKVNPNTGLKETVTDKYMEGTKLGSYFKSVHYADEAIGQLINDLDKKGLLDNTVIVIYGDHDAKLKKDEFNRLYNYDFKKDKVMDESNSKYDEFDYYDYELNRKVPLIIWTKDSKDNKVLNKEITKVMGMIDVLPTLGNMFDFNSKYALGNDIFSVKDNVVVFPNGNFLTDKIYYSQSKDEYKVINNKETISKNYIEKYNKISDNRISVSDSIIVYDLLKKMNKSN